MKRLFAVSLYTMATAVLAEPTSVSKAAAALWLRQVIPLPHEATIPRSVTVPQEGVKLTLLDNSPLGREAARRLVSLFREKGGLERLDGDAFEFVLGVVDGQGRMGGAAVPDAVRFKTLPNPGQAYLIRPLGDKRLALAALDSRGLFYAALTLRQLLGTRFSHSNVSIPLAIITDWPDMAERGLWGGSSVRDIEWMAERKMNLVEFHSPHRVDESGKAIASVDASLLRRGRTNAVKMVPIISHINHLGSRGVYKAYPELRGKGEGAKAKSSNGDIMYAPCASNPKLAEILAGWMKGYAASDEHVRDISCWLGELHQRCECENCAKLGQFALETRAFVNAWRIARKDFPDLRIRILLTQGSYATNNQVLAQVPEGVGVTYYDGGRTYDSSKDPMVYPLLEEYAAKGHWLGVYPQLTSSWRIESPWSSPQFVKSRMTEFVDKKLSCLVGYVVIDNLMNDFNVTAGAEWSWNAHGRDEAEFARAWAVSKGIRQPDRVADWALALGAAGWDIYGARLVERYFFRPARIGGMLRSRSAPAFGQGMLRYIPDMAHLGSDHAACREAVRIARAVGSSDMLAESRTIESYYRVLLAIVRTQRILSDTHVVEMTVRVALQTQMNRLSLAAADNVLALRDWERSVRVGAGGGRFLDSLKATGGTVDTVAKALARFGVRQPDITFTPTPVREWRGADFEEQAKRDMVIEITDRVREPGDYRVRFQYTRGWNGLHMWRTALASSPKDAPRQRTELSADEHEGFTGARSEGNVYQVRLEQYDPARRYWLVAHVRGTPLKAQKPGHVGCYGEVQMMRVPPSDWPVRIMATKPLTEDEMPVAGKVPFKGVGVRVGVIDGAYGSSGILAFLKKQKGIDAVLVSVGGPRVRECQVIVFPQLRWEGVAPGFIKKLEAFVTAGGGLISAHDAVGYRSSPKILVDVCAGGVAHTRGPTWKRTATHHPLTAGLAAGKELTRGYYDQIELAVGPSGTSVAVASESGRPVVVAGKHGKGRYVACGFLLGCDADAKDAPPSPDEARLLLNAVRWCAGD